MTHYLSSYAKFSSKEVMDAAARMHLDIHWNKVNKTDRAVLEMIRCYSVKYLAAHLNHRKEIKPVEFHCTPYTSQTGKAADH